MSLNNIKLDSITSEYSSFVDNQVLTAKQLNDIIEFFEDQQRLTRTCLVGVGLVCGFGFKGNAGGITVSKGCAVTTDGDLLYMQDTAFTHFRAYDNKLVKYPPFYPSGTDKPQMSLWELTLADPATNKLPGGSLPLAGFQAKAGKTVQQMVGLLYLEYYLKDPDACTAIDCDNQGKKQVAKLRVLLLSPADMELIINRTAGEIIADDIFRDYFNAYTQYISLAVPGAKRALLNDTNTASQAKLCETYISIVNAGYPALSAAIVSLYNNFKFILDKSGSYNISSEKTKLEAVLKQVVTAPQAQYFYDFYKDIVTAYNELRSALIELVYICCPDIYAFPKHIMLGYLNAAEANTPAQYRHRFYPSPAVTENKARVTAAISMTNRLFLLMNNFLVPAVGSPVKVTPSADYDRLMEHRAIPFYYDNISSVAAKWNHEMWRRGTDKRILSYHASQYAGGNDMIVSPLNYSIDTNNFFRVEGHIGRTYNDALKKVNDLRKDYDLPFDVVAMRMGDVNLSDIDINDYACQFADLEAVLNAFKAEQNCLYAAVAKFFSNFDVRTGNAFYTTNYRQYSRNKSMPEEAMALLMGDNEKAVMNEGTNLPLSEPANYSYRAPGTYTLYSGVDAVDNNLYTDEYALGYYFDKMRQDEIATTISDYAEAAATYIDTSDLDDDMAVIAVDIPLRMIAGTRNISEWLPDRLMDIDEDTLTNFSEHLDELCAEVKDAMNRSRKIFIKQTYQSKGYEHDYELRLWQLLQNCCAGEAMEVILKEVLARKEKLLKQLTFSAYALSHPGLEHKAGVHRGGTFVMVYASAKAKISDKPSGGTPTQRFAFLLQNQDFVKGFSKDNDLIAYLAKNISPGDAKDAVEYYMGISKRSYNPTQKQKVIDDVKKAAKAYQESLVDDEDAVAKDIVFADFCLPYICCSDCPPVAFITPEPKISLSLPKNIVCSDDSKLQFSVSPADGVVKASLGFEGTVVLENSQYFFDPSKVADGSFGKTIQFTVNDQPTSCSITVLKHPEIIKLETKVTGNTAMGISIQFIAEANQLAGDAFLYTWDVGDPHVASGGIFKDLNTPNIVVFFSYDDLYQNHPDGKLHATLTVTNQSCTATQGLDYTIELPPILVLEKTEVCSADGPVEFMTVKPDGGVVTGTNVSKNGATGKWEFDPSNGPFEVPINDFKVNSIAVANCQITVHELPAPSFTYSTTVDAANGTVELTCTNTTPHAASYNFTWNIDGVTSTGLNVQKTFDMTPFPSGRTILVTLTAAHKADAGCQQQTSPQTAVQLPGVQVSLALAVTQVCSGAAPVGFITVSPANGIVSKQTNPLAVKQVGPGKWEFDPSSGPFGVPVNDFTVNGIPVPGCQIIVNESPEPRFAPNVRVNASSNDVEVTCNNFTPNPAQFDFTWLVDDVASPATGDLFLKYPMTSLPPMGKDIVVELRAKNKKDGDCQKSFKVTIHLPGQEEQPGTGGIRTGGTGGIQPVNTLTTQPGGGTVAGDTTNEALNITGDTPPVPPGKGTKPPEVPKKTNSKTPGKKAGEK
jgi:hypothetical protein